MALDHLICPSCGNLRSVCSDPERDWYAQRTVCHATAMTRWANQRRAAILDGKDSLHILPKASDGETVWVSQHDLKTADDEFL